ncbi:MAG: L-serine ammonia-lyase, iron-sulfur-dependent, subunit beta [Clostridiales bacterium]|nr:L-serine ammonia-lyase, iron-sulfur-dependent, subunit beta [Clostridiales bacterium]
MTIFDIMGPVMVGPSSSHTAGAVRIGLITRRLLGETPARADIKLHGSFAATGAGHGTDKALAAGLLGLMPDDTRIPHSFSLAQEAGMALSIGAVDLRDAHPNTVILSVTGQGGRQLEVNASSLGGGRVRVNAIDAMEAAFTGDYPTLIIRNEDRPGLVAEVSTLLSEHGVNIATMQLYRDRRGGLAVMVIESDQPIPAGMLGYLRTQPGIVRCTYLDMEEGR